jgi:LacI family transcriptional regulator
VVIRLVEAVPATAALLELIAAAGLPCVCLESRPDPRFGFDSVLFDSVGGAHDATAYLLAHGHRRIGHLAGDPMYESARARRAGYERALTEAGVALDPRLVHGGSWDPNSVNEAVRALRALPDPPTAIFAANDSLAFRAIEVLRTEGCRIPEDVAVVGFDDIPLAQEMIPPLTTMRIPLAEIGQRAAARLLELVTSDAPAKAESDVVAAELVLRGTA